MKWQNVFLICFLIAINLQAQEFTGSQRNLQTAEKIERLEQAKLIEVLNLDEENAIRFFARRNEFQNNFRNMMKERENLFQNLEESIRAKNINESRYNDNINAIINFEVKLAQERHNFINSLNTLLSPEQVAKYIIFEHKFRRELTQSLMHRQNRAKK